MTVKDYINQLSGDLDEEACMASDALAEIGTSEVKEAVLALLQHQNDESKIMAARTLSLMADNEFGLAPLLSTIEAYPNIAGELFAYLEDFDLSEHYVVIFKYSLSKNFKIATLADHLLMSKEYRITPRVLKKIKKAWHHYENNTRHDDVFMLKNQAFEQMISNLQGSIS